MEVEGGRSPLLCVSSASKQKKNSLLFPLGAPRSVPNLAEGIEESSETTPGEYRGPLRCEKEGRSIRLAPLFSLEKALNVFSFELLTHRHRVCLSLSLLSFSLLLPASRAASACYPLAAAAAGTGGKKEREPRHARAEGFLVLLCALCLRSRAKMKDVNDSTSRPAPPQRTRRVE